MGKINVDMPGDETLSATPVASEGSKVPLCLGLIVGSPLERAFETEDATI